MILQSTFSAACAASVACISFVSPPYFLLAVFPFGCQDKVDGIRKNKRKESLRKRRAIKTNALFSGDGVSTGNAASSSATDRPEYAPQLANLPAMIKGLSSAARRSQKKFV